MAGWNASTSGMINILGFSMLNISFETYMKMAGYYHQATKYNISSSVNKIVLLNILLIGSSYGGVSPWYGEIEYAGRWIKKG